MHLQKDSTPLKRATIPNKTPNQRIASLKDLMSLEEQREALQLQLDKIQSKVASLQFTICSTVDTHLRHDSHLQSSGGSRQVAQRPRMPRGGLRKQIFEALRAGGSTGVLVKDLAVALAMRPVNIHSWFHSALKRYPQIEKLAPGHYLLNGNILPTSTTAPSQTRPLATGRSGRQRMRPKRGEISRQILELLRGAGSEGISVAQIAAHTGSHYRNIHVWFSSTGKKNPLIQRINRGIYRLQTSNLV